MRIWKFLLEVPAIFSNTGLEYPEIVAHPRTVIVRTPPQP